jgi:hypothetical protein
MFEIGIFIKTLFIAHWNWGIGLESYYFCKLGAHAKSRNPTTTPSGRKGIGEERRKKINLPKIVAT